MLPSSFVATPTSAWYMAAGIHLLNAGVSDDVVAGALASTHAVPNTEGADAATGIFANVKSMHIKAEDGTSLTESWQNEEARQLQLSAELVSAVATRSWTKSNDPLGDKVKEWMNENGSDSPMLTPEWASSDDECTEEEEDERRKDLYSATMRAMQMSPSNLRPMTANYEACEPIKKSPEDTTEDTNDDANADTIACAELEEAAAKSMIREEQLARTIEFMCKVSGERPVDVQAMYIYKLQLCSNDGPHDWMKCSFAHGGEIARRRDPSTHSANPCSEYERNQTCTRGDKCRFSHGVWERGLHPQRYRTSLCSKGEKCDRRICFFAHTPAQLRKATNGKGWNNESIASLTPATGSETRLSRRKARAIQRSTGANTKTIKIEGIPPLPPPQSGGVSCGKPPLPKTDKTHKTDGAEKADKITVEVDSKLTNSSSMVEGLGTQCISHCISPGSSGTGDLSTASLSSSSQASTVHAMAWAEENFGAHGTVEEVPSASRPGVDRGVSSVSSGVANGVQGAAQTPRVAHATRAAHRKVHAHANHAREETANASQHPIEHFVQADHLGDPESKFCICDLIFFFLYFLL